MTGKQTFLTTDEYRRIIAEMLKCADTRQLKCIYSFIKAILGLGK